jgi:hypothetical protein
MIDPQTPRFQSKLEFTPTDPPIRIQIDPEAFFDFMAADTFPRPLPVGDGILVVEKKDDIRHGRTINDTDIVGNLQKEIDDTGDSVPCELTVTKRSRTEKAAWRIAGKKMPIPGLLRILTADSQSQILN